jgi:signal transduction histidine kinase
MTDSGARDAWVLRWLLPAEPRPDDGEWDRARRTARDWVVDSLVFAVAVAVGAALLFSQQDADYLPRWMLVIDPPLGALSCVALWWRRRFPLPLAVGLIPVGALSASCFGALTVAVLNLGLRVPFRTGLLVVLAHLAAAGPYLVLYSVPHEGGWTSVAFIVAYYLFFFSWGAGMRLRRQLVTRLLADAQREREVHARRLADVRRAEREAIAREMHDVLAHRISLLSVHAGALAYRTGRPAADGVRSLTPQEIGASAQLIRDTAHQALEELREVLTVLRGTPPGTGGPQPGIDDIETLVTEAERAGQRVTLTRAYDATAGATLRGPVQRTAYRVVQEGLTNARKHAPGAPVDVSVTGAPGRGLKVAVRNPRPADAPGAAGRIPGSGAGLVGLEERAALDGGRLTHGIHSAHSTHSTGGTVFELVAELPWGPAEH